jgi:hypothetical protein
MVMADILMVIFEDRTSLGDSWEVHRALAMRKQMGEWYAGLVEDLKLVADSQDVLGAIDTRRQALLSGHLAVDKGGDASVLGLRAQSLQNVAANLRAAGVWRISSEIARYQALADAATKHSVLAGGGQ